MPGSCAYRRTAASWRSACRRRANSRRPSPPCTSSARTRCPCGCRRRTADSCSVRRRTTSSPCRHSSVTFAGVLAATTGSVMLLSPLRRLCYGAAPIRFGRSLGNGPLACKRAGRGIRAERFPMTGPQEAAYDPARQPARLLRRRRSCDPDRRARASSATARRSMSATRSCTTATSSRASRPRARSSSTSSTRCPDDRPGGVLRPWRAEGGAGRGRRAATCSYLDATCPLVSKVHREAERQLEAGRTRRPDRPCRPSRGDRHHGPAARRRGAAGRDRGARPRRSTSPDPPNLAYVTQTTLSVDDTAEIVAALRRALSRHRGPEDGGHLLRHHQPAGRGQGDRPSAATRWW